MEDDLDGVVGGIEEAAVPDVGQYRIARIIDEIVGDDAGLAAVLPGGDGATSTRPSSPPGRRDAIS